MQDNLLSRYLRWQDNQVCAIRLALDVDHAARVVVFRPKVGGKGGTYPTNIISGAEVLAKAMIGYHVWTCLACCCFRSRGFAAMRGKVHEAYPAEHLVPLRHSEADRITLG